MEKIWKFADNNKVIATWNDRGFFDWSFHGAYANSLMFKMPDGYQQQFNYLDSLTSDFEEK